MSNSQEKTKERRSFLTKLSFTLGGFAAAAAAVPVVAALLNPLIVKKPKVWRRVGSADDFQTGDFKLVKYENADPKPWAGSTDRSAAWVRKDGDDQFTVFSVNCTHLGCPVRWKASAKLFFCPCHGGVYRENGSVAAGPPPESLHQYPVRVKNGQVEIETSAIPVTTVGV